MWYCALMCMSYCQEEQAKEAERRRQMAAYADLSRKQLEARETDKIVEQV
jgi:hypothetical protein